MVAVQRKEPHSVPAHTRRCRSGVSRSKTGPARVCPSDCPELPPPARCARKNQGRPMYSVAVLVIVSLGRLRRRRTTRFRFCKKQLFVGSSGASPPFAHPRFLSLPGAVIEFRPCFVLLVSKRKRTKTPATCSARPAVGARVRHPRAAHGFFRPRRACNSLFLASSPLLRNHENALP